MTPNKTDYIRSIGHKQMLPLLNKLSIFTCALIATNAPADAVDYLQCREMVRTKNEMLDKSVKNEYNRGLGYIPDTDQCPDYQFMKPNPYYEGFNKKHNIAPAETVDYQSQRKCIEEQKQITLNKVKPYKKVGDLVFYTKSGYEWYLAALKVSIDMKKRNCPYQ